MIDLTDLKGLDEKETKALVEEETGKFLNVYLPRTTKQFFSEREAIAYDYAFAAYSGQLLFDTVGSFGYEFSTPGEFDSYCFEVKDFDNGSVAGALYKMSCLYGYSGNDEDEEDITIEDVNQFLGDVGTGKTIPACPKLIDIFEEYSEEESD